MRERELAHFEEAPSCPLGPLRIPNEAGLEDRRPKLLRHHRTVVHHKEQQQRLALVLHPANTHHDLAAGRNVVQ